MKIELEREKLLSNFEVYQHLKQIQKDNNWDLKTNKDGKKDRKVRKAFNPDLEAISRDIVSYLEKSNIQEQTEENVSNCITDLASKFPLEKIEVLQVINSKPRSFVSLYAVVEECDQRFSEEQSQEILDIVNQYFPSEQGEEEEGEEEEEGAVAENEDVEME
ncbi:hypothetical protein WICPIJ_003069 [Wickerhamomyces pijperi]|uniref:DNA-directed RNA polymerase III subunit RPC9 n=1 Tax=Wickerhamomyces pijperi TaxID=599730 RepID=A0A9P8QAE1_WICPI|nr:hypothetical protein WICPIJ_003069 [Wickerhamomyces pijperi]